MTSFEGPRGMHRALRDLDGESCETNHDATETGHENALELQLLDIAALR